MSDVSSTDGIGINSPELTPSGKRKLRSIKDAGQAWNIISSLEQANQERNLKNARILAKYNAEQPHSQTKLDAEGLGWKSNFSTKPLAVLIDKVAPRITNAIDQLRYFTASELPDHIPGASRKTELFRKEITETIRKRPEWSDFVHEVAMENSLFGYAGVGWLNEFVWFPRCFRQDSFFVPNGTKHRATTAQIVVFKEGILPHELFELIEDRAAAEAAGWDVKNTIEAINAAMPETAQSKYSDHARLYEELARESNLGISHMAGAKVVQLYHLFSVEIDGKVSHRVIDGYSHKELFNRDDQFDSMSDCAAFFSWQLGNGKLHGSKGVGREIYNIAGVIDRARNEVVDRLQLAGKLVLQGDPKQLHRFKMSVVGNAVLIDNAYNISERAFDGKVEPFFKLDEFMGQLLDQIVGNVSPRHLEGDRVTKAQVDLFAAREEESKDVKIARFLTQFASLISVMQRKMCSERVSEKDARDMQKRLLKEMSRGELDMLAEQPSAQAVRDFTEFERQSMVLLAQEKRGHPLYNQRELEQRDLTARFGADFAEAVLLQDPDPTESAEQTRAQNLELLFIAETAGEVPVSPRDNHRVHLDVLRVAIEGALEPLAENPADLPKVMAMISHAKAHVAFGTEAKVENFSGDAAFLTEIEKRLVQLQAHEQAALQAAQSGAVDPSQVIDAGAQAAMGAVPQQA